MRKRPAYSGLRRCSSTTPSTLFVTESYWLVHVSVTWLPCLPKRASVTSAFPSMLHLPRSSIGEPGGLTPAAGRVELEELLLALLPLRVLSQHRPAVAGP